VIQARFLEVRTVSTQKLILEDKNQQFMIQTLECSIKILDEEKVSD
jgi:hypothetical protein